MDSDSLRQVEHRHSPSDRHLTSRISSRCPRGGSEFPSSQPHAGTCKVSFPKIISGRIDDAVQPGRNGRNCAGALDRSMQRRIFPQCQARARLIVVCRIGGKNSPEVPFAEDKRLIQALAAQCADQPFSTAILPWRSRRDRSVADTHCPHPRREDVSVGTVVVAHQVGRRRGPRKGLGDLLSQPVFSAHLLDQISQAAINSWPPCPSTRFPMPKHFEPSAMPAGRSPAAPPARHQDGSAKAASSI